MKSEPAPQPRTWPWRLLRAAAAVAGGLAGLAVLAFVVVVVLYQQHVVNNPGPHLERSHIQAIIAQESPVYYRDGVTRIGVFFEDEHREYVPWDALPPAYVIAIVAAEDGGYWTHAGVSPKHIARAMVQNAKAGEVVAGGSTLTQQTAKNLYYRPDRSARSKWTELVNALRLEAHYEKHEILTFYVNQFHVSGNGRGLGIAARYFFDEDVEDLTVLESAFLAGLVKAPSHYDPFIGDEDRRARSVERAHDRTRYVLQRLVDEPLDNLAGPIPGKPDATAGERLAKAREVKEEAQRLLDEGFELPFKRGTFRYDSSAVLDEVARRLHEAPFDEVLTQAGIEDPSTAGLVVVTTLDPDVQRESIYALWHHLTEVGAMLEGRSAADFVRTDSKGPRFAPEHAPRRHEFREAEITRVLDPTDKPHFEADLGGHTCIIDRDGVIRAALWVHRGEQENRTVKVPTADVNAFAGTLGAGDIVWVSVRDAPLSGSALCDLELRPELQGAVMVVEDGQVRAMVGGNDNRNFNRATALRQMGSTWKPVVYHAALKLGWSPTDELYNQRTVFPFSTTFYYPRPDHAPEPVVSMAWAGVNSENLASIWLLYHLTDHLNGEQTRVLAEALGMARREDESASDYRTRIQKMGVLPTSRRVEEALFLQARQEVLTGLALQGHPDDELGLRALLYGWGFEAERTAVAREPARDRAWKLQALDNSWIALRDRMDPCEAQYRALDDAWSRGRLPDAQDVRDLTLFVDDTGLEVACGAVRAGYVSVHEAITGALADDTPGVTIGGVTKPGKPPRLGRRRKPRPDDELAFELAPLGDMLIEDRLHFATLEALEGSIRRRRLARTAAGDDAPGLYDPEVLYWHQDFRVLLGMRYVTTLAAEYGVQTDLQEVLSLPLGASEVTLEEAVSLYQGVTTGQAWTFPGKAAGGTFDSAEVASPPAPTLLIAEIRDVDGNVLYQASGKAEQITPVDVADMTADILRNVVEHGTGARANGLLTAGAGKVPLGGKTGTTNDFRNAAFLGFVPTATRTGFAVEGGYTIGVYVGYDDNRPMDRGGIRISGSSGALPAWNLVALGLSEASLLGDPNGRPEDGWWELQHGPGLAFVDVESTTGRMPEEGQTAGARVLAPRRVARLSQLDLEVHQPTRPPRVAPRTDDWLQRAEERRQQREDRAERRPSVWDAP